MIAGWINYLELNDNLIKIPFPNFKQGIKYLELLDLIFIDLIGKLGFFLKKV